jgi:hypothetical protein
MRINIGFSFHAGDALLPAGEYWIEAKQTSFASIASSALLIRSLDGKVASILPVSTVSNDGKLSDAYMKFTQYGDSYFLSEVHQSWMVVSLAKSRAEKEVKLAYAKKMGAPIAQTLKVTADTVK